MLDLAEDALIFIDVVLLQLNLLDRISMSIELVSGPPHLPKTALAYL